MKLVVRSRDVRMTPALRRYLHLKLVAPAQRRCDSSAARMHIELSTTTSGKRLCTVRFAMPGAAAIHLSTQAGRLLEAIDATEDRLLIQIKRQRELRRRALRGGRAPRSRGMLPVPGRAPLTLVPD